MPFYRMESVLRKAVSDTCPNVEVWHKSSVNGMELSPTDSTRVAAALIRKGGAEKVMSVPCALLLDCTGPALASRKWLPKVGYTAPEKVTYDPGVVCTSRLLHLLPFLCYHSQAPTFSCLVRRFVHL